MTIGDVLATLPLFNNLQMLRLSIRLPASTRASRPLPNLTLNIEHLALSTCGTQSEEERQQGLMQFLARLTLPGLSTFEFPFLDPTKKFTFKCYIDIVRRSQAALNCLVLDGAFTSFHVEPITKSLRYMQNLSELRLKTASMALELLLQNMERESLVPDLEHLRLEYMTGSSFDSSFLLSLAGSLLCLKCTHGCVIHFNISLPAQGKNYEIELGKVLEGWREIGLEVSAEMRIECGETTIVLTI
jgi:hypothetical protein